MENTSKARIERQIAKKLWIKEVLEGQLVITDGLQPNILKTSRGDAGRVSVMGVVIASTELPTPTIILDDSTGQINVRSFERALPFEIGDFVHVFGRPRTYQGESYIAAEGIAKIRPEWVIYRQSELGEVVQQEKPVVKEAPTVVEKETSAERLIKLIIDLDRGEGAPIEEVVVKSKIIDAERIIQQLLLAGDIFELRPGKLKVL